MENNPFHEYLFDDDIFDIGEILDKIIEKIGKEKTIKYIQEYKPCKGILDSPINWEQIMLHQSVTSISGSSNKPFIKINIVGSDWYGEVRQ